MSNKDECRYDLATEVLLAIFNRAWASMVGELETPQQLIINHRKVIDGAFRILSWLDLVEPDNKLEFGYKPTSRLVQIFVNRGAGSLRKSKKKGVSIIDVDALFSIFDAAKIELSDQELHVSAYMLLRTLGLVRITQRGEEVPTQELRELGGGTARLRAESKAVAFLAYGEGCRHGRRHSAGL